MTTQDAFTPDEWKTILEGPTSAATAVITAARGGTFRETFAEAKFFADARQHHGQSELLDAIVAHKPVVDHAHPRSKDDFVTLAVAHLRDAVSLISQKASPQELADYRGFVTSLCKAVAAAHREGGADVAPEEVAVIQQLAVALGGDGS
jgi:hypothetical protein